MKLVRQHHVHAKHLEQTVDRYGCANGFKDRALPTRLVTVALSVRLVRGSDAPFQPASLDTAMASRKALRIAQAEMTS